MVQSDAGQAWLLGENSRELRPTTGRARIAYLAEGHPLYRWMSVGEAVRFTRGFYDTWQQSFLDGFFDDFGIYGAGENRRLSNGQRAGKSGLPCVAPESSVIDPR